MQTTEYDIVTEAEEQFTLEYSNNGIKFYINNSMVYCEIDGTFRVPTKNTWVRILDIDNPKLMNGIAIVYSLYNANIKVGMYNNCLDIASADATGNLGFIGSFMYPRGDKKTG